MSDPRIVPSLHVGQRVKLRVDYMPEWHDQPGTIVYIDRIGRLEVRLDRRPIMHSTGQVVTVDSDAVVAL